MAVATYIAALMALVVFGLVGCIAPMIVAAFICGVLLIRHELLWLLSEAVYRSGVRRASRAPAVAAKPPVV